MIKCAVLVCLLYLSCGEHKGNRHHQLKIEYDGDAKIEVGGPFAGVEFHHSACLPQRISFYYPVANSIDLSTDYWRRDTTFVMAAGLRFGNEKKIWLGRDSLPLSLTPYRVEFFKEDSTKDIRIVYQFAMTKPVLVISFIIRNKTAFSQSLDFETHLETTLRTSHSFSRKNRAWTTYDPQTETVFTYHTEEETGKAALFVTNAAAKPVSFSTIGPLANDLYFSDSPWPDGQKLIPAESPAASATRLLYKEELLLAIVLKLFRLSDLQGRMRVKKSPGKSPISTPRKSRPMKNMSSKKHLIICRLMQEIPISIMQRSGQGQSWRPMNIFLMIGFYRCPVRLNIIFTLAMMFSLVI